MAGASGNWGAGRGRAIATWHGSACYGLAVMFVFTGVAHFAKTMKHDLARMVPAMFPRPLLLVYFTGILEFMGAVGLLLPRFRWLAGICLIALLIVDVSGQRERGDDGSRVGRETGHAAVAADSHATAIDRASVVVQPPVTGAGVQGYGLMTTSLGLAGSTKFSPCSWLSLSVAGTSKSAI